MLFRIFVSSLLILISPALFGQGKGRKYSSPKNGGELSVAKAPEFANLSFRLGMTAKLDLSEYEEIT